ncbi:MAG: NAD(P)-dependent oxidoreductase [Patescibacteria group bacterium]|jgi:nucleoside-diphosphate-sugar epimerase
MKKTDTILLTGGTGFLGSQILKLLAKKGQRVIVLKRKNSDLSRVRGVVKKNRIIYVDLKPGFSNAGAIFRKYKIDYVIHAATCYGRKGEPESKVIEANLTLPLLLLGTGITSGVKGFINADTFTRDKKWIYARTKEELVSRAKKMVKGKKIKFINLKIEHMYGPGDSAHKFIPWVIGELKRNAPAISFTKGRQKRDLVCVEDASRAFFKAIENFSALANFQEFEIGTGQSRSIRKLVLMIKKMTGNNTSRLNWGALPYKEGEAMDSRARVSRNKKLKWRAEYDLKNGLKKTLEYYLSNK